MASPKSKFWSRIAYACGTFGHDVFYMMLATYFMIFVTSNLFHSDNHEQVLAAHRVFLRHLRT